jgi:hypothetical protein
MISSINMHIFVSMIYAHGSVCTGVAMLACDCDSKLSLVHMLTTVHTNYTRRHGKSSRRKHLHMFSSFRPYFCAASDKLLLKCIDEAFFGQAISDLLP